ncbi:MAG: protein kinase, partial [Planctomycetota bacterium]
MVTNTCVPREDLKAYLAGWVDPESCESIEAHLADCNACEETIVSLESDPETLIECIRTARRHDAPKPGSASSLHAQGTQGDVSLGSPDDALSGNVSEQASLSSAPVEAALAAAREMMNPGPDEADSLSTPLEGNIGAYELLRPIGRGGMGAVYLARHKQLGKEVAIKLLPARSLHHQHFAARFQREIRAAGGLQHPAIVQATDAGEHEGTQYLVMEYIDGLDLSRLGRCLGPMSVENACAVVRSVALGMSHAHAEGIVHRDIKPSNLMVGRDGAVKILDFGLARVGPWDEASAELTTVGQLMGTLDYMAPEQAERADSVDYRADLYSLGATLYRLLCGRPPLSAAPDLSPLAKLRLLATTEPPRLQTLRPDVPDALAEFVDSMLSRSPEDRPASAAHVAEFLESYANGTELPELVEQACLVQERQSKTDFGLVSQPRLGPAHIGVENTKRGGRSWTSVLAIAALPFLLIAGVIIALETQKGELVIRSEANVSVKIQKDGKVYRELKVVPGNQSTRLYAGRYEVTIDGASDQVEIGEKSITIRRGEIELATISKSSRGGAPPASDAILQSGDLLTFSSPTDDKLKWTGRVAADSTIRVPLIGDVSVAGMTLDSAEAALDRAYSGKIKNSAIDLFRAEPGQNALAVVASGRIIPPASTTPLEPGDGLRYSSVTDHALQGTAIVQADHTIRVVMIGTVDVQGMAVAEAEIALNKAYSGIVKSPAITLLRDYTISAPAADVPLVSSGAALVAEPSALSSIPSGNSESTESDYPDVLYRGRPLSEWLRILPLERSPEGVSDVLGALSNLGGPETSPVIVKTLREVLPKQSWPMGARSEVGLPLKLHAKAFEFLRFNDESYCEYLLDQLKAGSDPWRKTIIRTGLSGLEWEQYEPFHAWMFDFGFPSGGELANASAAHFTEIINVSVYPEDRRERLIARLLLVDSLDDEFWFSPVRLRHRFVAKQWLSQAKERALRLIESKESTAPQIASAVSALAGFLSIKSQLRTSETSDDDVADVVSQRLKSQLRKPVALLEAHEIPIAHYPDWRNSMGLSSSFRGAMPQSLSQASSQTRCTIIRCLLRLIPRKLQEDQDLAVIRELIDQAMEPTAQF